MKVNFTGYNLYKNQLLKKGLEFVADNGSLFAAGGSLALATVARPIAIYATPKTDKENRKLACAKSIASSAMGFCLMLGASVPIANSVKKINNAPEKYLKEKTINALKDNNKKLTASKGYQFATQLFKLGIGAAAAIPKAVITCALIPPIMNFIFHKKDKKQTDYSSLAHGKTITQIKDTSKISFTGKLPKEPLTKGIAKIINSEKVQNFTNKYKDTNYPMHMAALTDTLATATFITQTKKSKKINDERKNTLIYNSAIATGLSIASSYVLDKALDKPTQKFIDKFKDANKTSPKLEKYVEGIKIAKPILIMGTVYYCAIPLISTFFAERINNKVSKRSNS